MTPNPLCKKLGYSDDDRLVIMHVDDLGMSYGGIQAFKDLWDFGTISSGAVMVPCPWFRAAVDMAAANPAMDIGLHATLNSEWSPYRWGPLSTHDPQTGLLDDQGYFYRDSESVYEHAASDAVSAELEAQLQRALAAGLDLTHIDSHMGTILHPNFVQSYLQAGTRHRLPNMLPRSGARGFHMLGMDQEALAVYAPILEQLEAQGVPMLDGLFAMPLEHDVDHLGIAMRLFNELPACQLLTRPWNA